MTMSFFFRLPDHLKVIVLDQWLVLPNICMHKQDKRSDLVGAVKICSRCRCDLVRLFASPGCVFQCQIVDEHGEKVKWILVNRVKVRNISLWRKHVEEETFLTQVLQHLAPTLTHLTLNLWNDYDRKSKYDASWDSFSDYEDENSLFSSDDEDGNSALFQQSATTKKILNQQQSNLLLAEVFSTSAHLEHFCLERKDSMRRTSPTQLDDSFCNLFQNCAHLCSVRLPQCADISAAIVMAMCDAPKLRHITVADASTFAHGALEIFPHNSCVSSIETTSVAFCCIFKHLKVVKLTEIYSADLAELARNCVHVTTVTVGLCDALQVCDAEAMCQHWRNVQSLYFDKSAHSSDCAVSEDALLVLLQHCTSLVILWCRSPMYYSAQVIPLPTCVYPPSYEGSRLRQLYTDCDSERVLHCIMQHCQYLFTSRNCQDRVEYWTHFIYSTTAVPSACNSQEVMD